MSLNYLDDISCRTLVGNAALEEINTLAGKSKLERLDSQVHDLSWSDVQEETTIGVGGFSRVYKVRATLPQLGYESCFALKCLSAGTMAKKRSFRTGAIDLAVEGEILSRLHHENLIQLHGVTTGGPVQAYVESERGYFLVLDLLEDTLQNKLDKYRHKRGLRSLRTRGTSTSSATERLQTVAIGVAKGLEYLHQKGVVLRDLKPDNVGFDKNGTPKIFDLGFAREVHTIQKKEVAGSLRYMAPEVALGKGTTLASDVYSFGVLLWELYTLEKPYKEYDSSKDEFMDNVIIGDMRPSLLCIPSIALRRLIKECWDPNPEARPTMSRVVKVLRIETSTAGGLTKQQASRKFTRSSKQLGGDASITNGGSSSSTPDCSMKQLNSSFGSSAHKQGNGRIQRMNSWSAVKKLSNSSLGRLKSMRMSSLGSTYSGRSSNSNASKTEATSITTTDEIKMISPILPPNPVANLPFDMFLLVEEELALLSLGPPASQTNMFLLPKKKISSWAKKSLETIECSPMPMPKPSVDMYHMMHNSCPELDFDLEEEIDEGTAALSLLQQVSS